MKALSLMCCLSAPGPLRSAYSSLSSPVKEVKANAVLIVKAQLVQLCKTQLEEFKAWQLNPQRTYLEHFGASSIEVIEDS